MAARETQIRVTELKQADLNERMLQQQALVNRQLQELEARNKRLEQRAVQLDNQDLSISRKEGTLALREQAIVEKEHELRLLETALLDKRRLLTEANLTSREIDRIRTEETERRAQIIRELDSQDQLLRLREAKLEEKYRATTARAELAAEDYFSRCLRTKAQLAKEAQQMRRAFKRRETELDSLIFQVQAQAS